MSSNSYLMPLAIVVAGLLIAGAVFLGARGQPLENAGKKTTEPVAGEVAGEKVVPKFTVTVDDDAAKGPSDAPVTVIEFSDFQCPFCQKYFEETYPKIFETYGDKVRYVFRDFPLLAHQNAKKAAEAAQCAGGEGKYFDFHDLLFGKQDEWKDASDAPSLFKKYAADLGLESSNFNSCLDSGKMADEVKKDLADGQQAGVSGTPTFFIGRGDSIAYDKAPTQTDPFFYLGDKKVGIVGAQPFEVFKAVIDEALRD